MKTDKPVATIHASLVRVNGVGILITGESGLGKSQLALKLVSNGHQLIADDAVEIFRDDDSLFGSAPDSLIGILQVRGIGLVDVRHLFGAGAVGENGGIDLSISLDASSSGTAEAERKIDFLGVEIRSFVVGNNLDRALFVETAARVFRNPKSLVAMDKITATRTNAAY